MKKLFRILGKRGRITIPYEIRQRVGFSYNDVLSFTEADDGRTVIVKREKICDNCRGAQPAVTKDDEVMLSFISLHRNGWQNHSYAAACGVSDQVMWQMLADHPQIDTVYLCHDSDVDGQKAAVRIANKLTEQGINTEILVPIRKDWNEDLLYPPDETEEEICIQTM